MIMLNESSWFTQSLGWAVLIFGDASYIDALPYAH